MQFLFDRRERRSNSLLLLRAGDLQIAVGFCDFLLQREDILTQNVNALVNVTISKVTSSATDDSRARSA